MIKCIGYISVKNGTFRGFADILLEEEGIEIYGCTLHSKDGKNYLNLPSRSYKDSKGKEKHSPVIRFSNPKRFAEICEQAKEAIDTYVTEGLYADPKDMSLWQV